MQLDNLSGCLGETATSVGRMRAQLFDDISCKRVNGKTKDILDMSESEEGGWQRNVNKTLINYFVCEHNFCLSHVR